MVAVGGLVAASVPLRRNAGKDRSNEGSITVSNVNYTLNSVNPYVIESVSFDAEPATGAGDTPTVVAELNGNQVLCIGAGDRFSCDFSKFAVSTLTADSLSVHSTVATQLYYFPYFPNNGPPASTYLPYVRH